MRTAIGVCILGCCAVDAIIGKKPFYIPSKFFVFLQTYVKILKRNNNDKKITIFSRKWSWIFRLFHALGHWSLLL